MSSLSEDIRQMLFRREIGTWPWPGSPWSTRWRPGDNNTVQHGLSSSLRTVRSWNPRDTVDHTQHGGIFNFGFSSDGSLLAAACEKKSVLLFDPHNGSLLSVKTEAHTDCVNCVRFLDSRTFATCSDDTSVCLWDARFLKRKVRTLQGHSNWVKNIEYDSSQGYLLTSGFDRSIYLWDINSYTEDSVRYERLLHTSGLMRSKLTPDCSKLVIATRDGYLMVIHDLDMATLPQDLEGFRPNIYRLTQTGHYSPVYSSCYAAKYNHLFTSRRNRVELIADFPPQDDAEMVASLELHPQGWCALSRNTSLDEKSEWTCVHDIQVSQPDAEASREFEGEEEEDLEEQRGSACRGRTRPEASTPARDTWDWQLAGGLHSTFGLAPVEAPDGTYRRFVCLTWMQSANRDTSPESDSSMSSLLEGSESESGLPELGPRLPAGSRSSGNSGANSPTSSGPPVRPSLPESACLTPNAPPTGDNTNTSESLVGFSTTSSRESSVSELAASSPSGSGHASDNDPKQPVIHQNIPRLIYYIEEPNVGRGFIKEICFSNDGRLVCSPFAHGVRLLAFSPQGEELCDCVPTEPGILHEVTSNISHSNVVVAVNYSPTHCLLVSGCLDGKVDFHHPVL